MDLDPLSAYGVALLGWMTSWCGRYAEATPHLRGSPELSPDYALAYWLLGDNLTAQERYTEAIASFERAAQLSHNATWVQGHSRMLMRRLVEMKKPSSSWPNYRTRPFSHSFDTSMRR